MRVLSATIADTAGVTAAPQTRSARNAGLDVLRGAVALLVVAHHTAITYGGSGDWFYREITDQNSVSSKLLSLFCGINQAWFMGLFFLLAALFTPPSVDRHGALAFARERLLRLGVPALVFGFVLGPVAIALSRMARGSSFVSTLLSLWSRGTFDLGPPWFCLALLIFSTVYLVLRGALPTMSREMPFPSDKSLLLAALATGAAAFVLRLVWPTGTTVLRLQLGYFASYVVLFIFGCMASRTGWLHAVPPERVRLWRRIALVAFPALPLAAVLGDHVPALGGSFSGGWSVPALVYAFWEPFVAWGVILVLLTSFQRRFATPGWVAQALGRRAYAIFILHPPVVVAICVLLRPWSTPPLLKFAAAGSLSIAACFVLAGVVLRIPGMRRVL